jgi:hypothetical protein
MPDVTLASIAALDGIRQAVAINLPPDAWWLRDPAPELEALEEILVAIFARFPKVEKKIPPP